MGGSTHARYGLWPVKLTIVGGGGFRVPLVYGALLAKRERLPFDEVVLHDLDEGRMERMATVLHGLAQERGEELPFRATTDLDDAVEGADFVFSAIRVGRLEGRVVDESVPLSRSPCASPAPTASSTSRRRRPSCSRHSAPSPAAVPRCRP